MSRQLRFFCIIFINVFFINFLHFENTEIAKKFKTPEKYKNNLKWKETKIQNILIFKDLNVLWLRTAGKAGRYVVTKTNKLFLISSFSRRVYLFTFSI